MDRFLGNRKRGLGFTARRRCMKGETRTSPLQRLSLCRRGVTVVRLQPSAQGRKRRKLARAAADGWGGGEKNALQKRRRCVWPKQNGLKGGGSRTGGGETPRSDLTDKYLRPSLSQVRGLSQEGGVPIASRKRRLTSRAQFGRMCGRNRGYSSNKLRKLPKAQGE